MEALRTRIDQLQWENNRLLAENRRLQDEKPNASRTMALEAELELSKGEVAPDGTCGYVRAAVGD